MMEKLTETFGTIAGQVMAVATPLRIHEVNSESWGYGGRAQPLEDARAIRERS